MSEPNFMAIHPIEIREDSQTDTPVGYSSSLKDSVISQNRWSFQLSVNIVLLLGIVFGCELIHICCADEHLKQVHVNKRIHLAHWCVQSVNNTL